MNITKISESYIENYCRLVNAFVKYQTCMKCCFKGEELFSKLLYEQDTCRQGCCKKEIYKSSQIMCQFLFSDRDE